MSTFDRRRFLQGSAALGVGAVLSACGSSRGPASADNPGGVAQPIPGQPFQHGVASGDPLADRVMLWTRVTVASDEAVPVAEPVALELLV